VDRVFELFRELGAIVPSTEVRMSGTWSAKAQRRYATREQLGTGEGPFVETVDWRWEGVLASLEPFVGIAVLATNDTLYWVKSQPPLTQASVTVFASAWSGTQNSVSFSGAFHGAHPPSVPVGFVGELIKSCVLGPSKTTTGLLHLVAQLGRAAFGVVLLPASAVKVGRNHLWHLREPIASLLPPRLHSIMTRGRTGELEFPD
jgi:hypothetical protein